MPPVLQLTLHHLSTTKHLLIVTLAENKPLLYINLQHVAILILFCLKGILSNKIGSFKRLPSQLLNYSAEKHFSGKEKMHEYPNIILKKHVSIGNGLKHVMLKCVLGLFLRIVGY